MDYEQALHYLYHQLPAFERQGAGAYKPGLGTSLELDRMFGQPHRHYKIVHVAGTNGKGSVAHTLAAILQLSGLKVGLYTSPHIIDFRERVRVNGAMMSREAVVNFLERYLAMGYEGHPTFFELTSTMAFSYFSEQHVDVAVVEVGLGGRLDSTNIVTPALSVITNISLDHTQFLGDTLEQVAGEKAGIIKRGVPVVIGEAATDGVRQVFRSKAQSEQAPIIFAQDAPLVAGGGAQDGHLSFSAVGYGRITGELVGAYQLKNANTVLHCVAALRRQGMAITDEAVAQGFARVCALTGLIGRWQQLRERPRVICDSGHNAGAFACITGQLSRECQGRLHMVLGFMADKDVQAVLSLLPREATYYFTQAQSPRAMRADDLRRLAAGHGLAGRSYGDVPSAYRAALAQATGDGDLVFVGGSMYVLADLLSFNQEQPQRRAQ